MMDNYWNDSEKPLPYIQQEQASGSITSIPIAQIFQKLQQKNQPQGQGPPPQMGGPNFVGPGHMNGPTNMGGPPPNQVFPGRNMNGPNNMGGGSPHNNNMPPFGGPNGPNGPNNNMDMRGPPGGHRGGFN